MVVNKVSNFFYAVICVYFVSFSVAYAGDLKNEVIKLAKKNIQIAVANFGKRTELCEQQRKATPVPVFDPEYLRTIDAKRHDILIGLAYLNFSHRDQCEADFRMRLAYAVGYLESAQTHYKLNSDTLKEVEVGLIYPSKKIMELTIKFNRLPEKLKKYLIKTVGDKAFDLMETIKANKLSAHNAECGRAEPYYFPCKKP